MLQNNFHQMPPVKKIIAFTFIFLIISGGVNGQGLFFITTSENDSILKYEHLSDKQLFDTAEYYFNKNDFSEALACYSLLLNMIPQCANIENQKKMLEVCFYSAASFYFMGDYYTSYSLLLEALRLSEVVNDISKKPRIYLLTGNIYYRFGEYDLAKKYYSEFLHFSRDSLEVLGALTNLGHTSTLAGDLEGANDFLNQALQIAKRHNFAVLHNVESSLATLYLKKKDYDLARYYYQQSIEGIKKPHVDPKNKYLTLATSLSGFGKLFFEINQPDSAIFYVGLSNAVALEHDVSLILVDNYLLLSQIAESQGRKTDALVYFKQHADLKEANYSRERIIQINQLQHLYEISNRDRQIEQYAIDQRIKSQTIRYQRTNQRILLTALILISAFLVFIAIQNRKLNTAYKTLFNKSLEIAEIQEETLISHPKKYKRSTLTDDIQAELLDKILVQMNNTSIICDTEFSVNKLAELVQSNSTYVSQVLNTALKKNFRSFLNEYRIKEAQRLFSAPDSTKYTIEAVAFQVGFKSRTAFRETFKEVTGVTPNFYLKSMQSLQSS
jgi:AraC-like DNA-binding protein